MGGGLKRLNLKSGFTIVELLIVIIVIAILATLVITAYNGVQAKAKNTKTIAALEAWTKAIGLYHADTGNWFFGSGGGSCIGGTTTYDGDGHCWNSAFVVQTSFLTAVKPYLGNGPVPEPDTTDINPSGTEYRGAFYYIEPTFGPEIRFMQVGAGSPCPKIGGLTLAGSWSTSNGVACTELLSP